MIDLSIVLITYNRAELLKKTIESLVESPFAGCELIVLNNHSEDHTVEVVERIKDEFRNMTLITHPFNIGGNANIMRAYEYGCGYYKWILCDDDVLDFSKCGDLLHVLENKEADLIRVAELGVVSSEWGTKRTIEDLLHDRHSKSFFSFGFVPGIIFRSDRVQANVQYGYKNMHSSYAQLFVLMKSFSIDSIVYTTKNAIVTRGQGVMGIGSEIRLYQLLSLSALPTKEARLNAFRRKHEGFKYFLTVYSKLILTDYCMDRSRSFMLKTWWRTILHTPTFIQKCIVFANVITILLPMRLIMRLIGKPLTVDMKEIEKRGYF